MEQKTNYKQTDIVRRVFYALKNRWLLILIIVIVAVLGGIGISYFQKPIYTATCKTVYKAEAELGEDAWKYDNITLTNRYLDTVLPFCSQGCIVDRANFYYSDYISKKAENEGVRAYSVDTYIKEEIRKYDKATDEYVYEDAVPELKEYSKTQYISMSNLMIAQPVEDSFVINISYTDRNYLASIEKLLLIFESINMEARVKESKTVIVEDENGNPKEEPKEYYKYFYNAKVSLTNTTNYPAPYNSVNRKKTVIIAGVVGIAVALAVVYIENMFNRTIRSRSELESCTGAGVLAYIDDQGV